MDNVFLGASPYKKIHKELNTPPNKKSLLDINLFSNNRI
jgi:hypothetical protein